MIDDFPTPALHLAEPGLGLLPQHADLLARSEISVEVARERGYVSVVRPDELRALGFAPSQARVPGLLIPVHAVDGRISLHQLRPDVPRMRDGKPVKYETAAGARMCLDVHPRVRPLIGDPSIPLVVTEGLRKADSATSAGIPCIGLLGVYNWRGKNTRGAAAALGDWESIALRGRDVYIAFDSDVMRKATVAKALERLKAFLESRGATALIIYLPEGEDGSKVGLDDFLATGATKEELFALAEPEVRQSSVAVSGVRGSAYRQDADGLLRVTFGRGGKEKLIRLSNFTGQILASVIEDDGVSQRRSVDLLVHAGETEHRLRVSSADFHSLKFVAEKLGPEAIVYPGNYVRDHIRAAIQCFSRDFPELLVYSHTGWRKLDQGWVYLHGGGAIGASGAQLGIEVSLPDDLERFRLPVPPQGPDLQKAVREVLALLAIAPPEISTSLIALVFRTVISGVDFGVHLSGSTGVFKTELAAIIQQMWGPDLNARHLPASWLSTPNSLEALGFAAKDTVLVVDDFAPRGSTSDVQRFHRDADRLLRAQGNHAGRQRMTADGELRLTRPPRGAVLSTGEDIPQGHSLRARLLVLEIGPRTVDKGILTAAQKRAAEGVYAKALAGFVQWLAGRYEAVSAEVAKRAGEIRDQSDLGNGHRRTPDIIANLIAGWEQFLNFVGEYGAISPAEVVEMKARGSAALLRAGESQGAVQRVSDIAGRCMELLRALFVGGTCHLAGSDGNPPRDAGNMGWQPRKRFPPFGGHSWEPRGRRIGWVDGDNLYLEPGSVFAELQSLSRLQGDQLGVTQRTLHNRLAEAGLLATDGGVRGRPVRRVLDGMRREVLHMRISALFERGTDQTGRES
jgi:hypothetical protein